MSLSKGCKLHCWAVPAHPHRGTSDTFWALVCREVCEKHNETFIYSFQQLPDPSCSGESAGSTCYRLLTHKVFPPLKGTAGCWVRRSCTVTCPGGKVAMARAQFVLISPRANSSSSSLPGTIRLCHPGRPCAVGTGDGTQERNQGTLAEVRV